MHYKLYYKFRLENQNNESQFINTDVYICKAANKLPLLITTVLVSNCFTQLQKLLLICIAFCLCFTAEKTSTEPLTLSK